LENWRERVPDCKSCNAETAGAKQNANKWDEKQIVTDNLGEQVE